MTDGYRPGSRSERHQRKRGGGKRDVQGASGQAGAAPFPPVTEPLRPTPPPRSARRAQQRVGRRKRRGLIILAVLAACALVAAALRFAADGGDGGDSGSGSTAASPQARTQRTLLLQIPDANGDAEAGALLATDPATGSASIVLVPSRVISQVPGFGSALFGEALKLGGPQLSKDTLANQLGIIIDDTWVMERPGLARLVDLVGGIEVEVDVEVPGGESGDGLRPGLQDLDGAEAAAFATYGLPDQPELGRLTRLQAVLVAVLDRIAADNTVLTGSAGAETAGRPPAAITPTLLELAKARVAQKLSYKTIPVTDIDNGSDAETTRLDQEGVALLVESELAKSLPPNEFRPANRVVVRNGVGTAGIGQSATRRLNEAGFVVVQTGNAPTFDFPKSQVLIFGATEEAARTGDAVAAALGLPEEAVEIAEEEQSVAEVIVTLGADYTAEPAALPTAVSSSAGVGP